MQHCQGERHEKGVSLVSFVGFPGTCAQELNVHPHLSGMCSVVMVPSQLLWLMFEAALL